MLANKERFKIEYWVVILLLFGGLRYFESEFTLYINIDEVLQETMFLFGSEWKVVFFFLLH